MLKTVAFSPQENYTHWGTAAGRRTYCQPFRIHSQRASVANIF
jgi:hypothetical protein